jgi:hypothetical protein
VLDPVKTACAPLRGGLRPVLTQSARGALGFCGPGRKAALQTKQKAFWVCKEGCGLRTREQTFSPVDDLKGPLNGAHVTTQKRITRCLRRLILLPTRWVEFGGSLTVISIALTGCSTLGYGTLYGDLAPGPYLDLHLEESGLHFSVNDNFKNRHKCPRLWVSDLSV